MGGEVVVWVRGMELHPHSCNSKSALLCDCPPVQLGKIDIGNENIF